VVQVSEGSFGLNAFLAAAIGVALLAEFGDLTLAAVVLCVFFVLMVRGDELLGSFWQNLAAITDFLTLKW